MKTDRKALLSLVAACVLLWSTGTLGPAPGLASQSPEAPPAPTLPEASDIWVSPTSLAFTVWEGGTANKILTIGNAGTDPLEWTMSVATGGTYLPGNWTVYYDWSCNGGPGSALWTFHTDNTFTTSEGSSGTWSQTDNQVVWTFSNGTQYTGYIAGNSMAGTMLMFDGSPGCWEAERVTTASVTLRTGERTASGESAEAPGVEIEFAVPDAEPVERVRPGERSEPSTRIEGESEIDPTTGRPATQALHRDLSPSLEVTAGGSVLWDLTHGVYSDYEPAARYSSLASLLTSAGYTVDTTTAGVENVSLWSYDVLVVNLASAWYSAYTPAEVQAIKLYVWNGGTLLVISENPGCPNRHLDSIARAFGTICGVADLSPSITRFVRHATTAGVGEIDPVGGGALLASPPAQAVALDTSDRTAVSAARVGWGRIVVVGDANLWDNVYIGDGDNQLSAENTFHWLSASWLSATPTAGAVPASSTRAVTAYVEDAYPTPPGEYGLLTIHTNDPDEALVAVPVSVAPQPAPDLVAIPSHFDFSLSDGETDQDTWMTYNLGSQALDWRLSTATGGTEVVGDWMVYFDWACDGSSGSARYTFNPDATFVEDYGGSGTWLQADNRLAWTYGSGTQYTGFVAGDVMAGAMHDYLGYRGCWEAERVRTPVVTVHAGERTPSGEPAETPGSEVQSTTPAAAAGRVATSRESELPGTPGPVDSGTDLATGSPAIQAPYQDLSPFLGASGGGRVLWDLTHGIYLGYHPGGVFSSLAAMLASTGYILDTTTAGVDSLALSNYDVLVVNVGSNWYSPYTPAEVAAIEAFVDGGGGLLILCENIYCPNANVNPVAGAFGTTCGVSNVGGLITNLASHSIFASAGQIDLTSGGEITAAAPAHQVAWNPDGKGVVTVAGGAGSGRVAVVGDMNLWDNEGLAQPDNQLFAENTFHWLASWLSATPTSGTTPGSYSSKFLPVTVDSSRYRPGEAGLVILYSNDPDDVLLALPVSLDVTYWDYLPIVLKP